MADTLTDNWGPIRIRGTNGNPVVQLEHCDFESMLSLLSIDTSSGPATVSILGCSAETRDAGVRLYSYLSGHAVSVQELALACTGTSGTGIDINPLDPGDPSVSIGGGTTVTGYGTGIKIGRGTQTILGEMAIVNSTNTGLHLISTDGGPQFTGPVVITNSTSTGVVVDGDIDLVANTLVNGSGSVGILHVADTAVQYQNIAINDSGNWGFYAINPTSGTSLGNTVVDSSGTDGIRAVGGVITVGDGVSITESNQSGVYLSGADATIHDADISDADTAIEVVNGSDVAITDSVIEYSYLGVYVMGSDTAA